MKKLFVILLVVGVSACKQDKIGFVDNVKLMSEYQEKIDVEEAYKKKMEVLSKKSDSLNQSFQLEYQQLQTRAQRMSQKKAQEELGLLQQKTQFIGQQLRQEEQTLQAEGQTKMDSVMSKVKTEIKEYGKANGYTYILTGGEGGSVLYGDNTKEITTEVIKLLNDKYKK